VLSEVWGDAFARGERRQRSVGSAQRGAMLVLPGDEQRLAILFQPERSAAFARDGAEAVGGINVLDPRNGRKLKAGLAGAPKKFERPGPDHRVIGDDLRRGEVTLQVGVLHELYGAEIRKPLAADRIARRINPDVQIEAGQVFDRVGILAAGQSPDR